MVHGTVSMLESGLLEVILGKLLAKKCHTVLSNQPSAIKGWRSFILRINRKKYILTSYFKKKLSVLRP